MIKLLKFFGFNIPTYTSCGYALMDDKQVLQKKLYITPEDANLAILHLKNMQPKSQSFTIVELFKK